jgi:hypothetical protein
MIRSNEQPLSETLPFESYRSTTNPTSISRPTITNDGTTNIFLRHQHNKIPNRNNNNYAGANRLSDDEYEQEEEGDEEDEDHERDDNNDDEQRQLKRRNNGQIHSQSSMQPVMMGDNFSRNIPSSSFVDTSVRSSPNSSTILMMMKGNGSAGSGGNLGGTQHQSQPARNGKSAIEHRNVVVSTSARPTSSGSSSSSSSLPVDEQQQQHHHQQHIKPRGYNFVPAPFNGTRLIAKSTEQLNRPFANDSLVKYCTPPTTPTTPLFQMTTKSNSPTSILKQNYLHKYTQPSTIQSSSKEKKAYKTKHEHSNETNTAHRYLFPFHHHQYYY